jgi:hypothetical protein
VFPEHVAALSGMRFNKRTSHILHFSFLSKGKAFGRIKFILEQARGTRWRSGRGIALQTLRSRVRFPMVSLDFLIDNLSGRN